MAPALDPLEARQLLNAAPMHFRAEPLLHHRAAFVEMTRHAHHASAGISAASAPLGAVQGLHVVTSPTVTNSVLAATAAIASNDIWAVGRTSQPLTEHFDGKSWSVVTPPPSPRVARLVA